MWQGAQQRLMKDLLRKYNKQKLLYRRIYRKAPLKNGIKAPIAAHPCSQAESQAFSFDTRRCECERNLWLAETTSAEVHTS